MSLVKKKKVRKSRDKEVKKKHDFSKPIMYDLSKIGTDEDCFGVMHDLTAPECKICGDCELCQIVYSQKAHSKREKEESKFVAKDLEEEALTGNYPKIREHIKSGLQSKSPLRLKKVIAAINNVFFPDNEKDPVYIKEIIKGFNIFKIYKEEGKLYLKIK